MITRVVLRVESTVYCWDSDIKRWVEVDGGASVRWKLSWGVWEDISLTVSPGTELDTNQLAGATQISLQATLLGGYALDPQLFRSSRTEEKQGDANLKLLVYFERSGTAQDQQEDRQSEKTKKSGLLDKIKRLFRK